MGQPSQNSVPIALVLFIIVGCFFLSGLSFVLGSFLVRRRKKVGPAQSRLILKHLIRWGVLQEEDIDQALNAGEVAAEKAAASPIAFAQIWPDLAVKGSPAIQQLILNWERPWAESSLDTGIWSILASLVSLVLVSGASLLTNLSTSDFSPLARAVLAVIFDLFILGMLAGVGIGLLKGLAKLANPSEQRATAPEASQRVAADYRSPRLVLIPVTLFIISYALALGVTIATPSNNLWLLLGLLGILPGLALALLLFCERLIHRLERLPELQLSADPGLQAQADPAMFPRMLQVLSVLEYGGVGFMALLQTWLLPETIFRGNGGAAVGVLIGIAILCLIVASLLSTAYGRLGGSVTGWPWSRRAG